MLKANKFKKKCVVLSLLWGITPPLGILISVSVTKEEEQHQTAQAVEEKQKETGLWILN